MKKIIILLLAMLIVVSSVNAWSCTPIERQEYRTIAFTSERYIKSLSSIVQYDAGKWNYIPSAKNPGELYLVLSYRDQNKEKTVIIPDKIAAFYGNKQNKAIEQLTIQEFQLNFTGWWSATMTGKFIKADGTEITFVARGSRVCSMPLPGQKPVPIGLLTMQGKTLTQKIGSDGNPILLGYGDFYLDFQATWSYNPDKKGIEFVYNKMISSLSKTYTMPEEIGLETPPAITSPQADATSDISGVQNARQIDSNSKTTVFRIISAGAGLKNYPSNIYLAINYPNTQDTWVTPNVILAYGLGGSSSKNTAKKVLVPIQESQVLQTSSLVGKDCPGVNCKKGDTITIITGSFGPDKLKFVAFGQSNPSGIANFRGTGIQQNLAGYRTVAATSEQKILANTQYTDASQIDTQLKAWLEKTYPESKGWKWDLSPSVQIED